jgi:hypothetical protein
MGIWERGRALDSEWYTPMIMKLYRSDLLYYANLIFVGRLAANHHILIHHHSSFLEHGPSGVRSSPILGTLDHFQVHGEGPVY